MATLTKKQKEIFDFIKNYINKHSISPTIEEVAKHFKRAVGTIHEHIEELAEKGFIKKGSNSSRSIELNRQYEMVKIPLLGTIAAGQPIEAIREKEVIAFPKEKLPRTGNIFALKVAGDSMIDENINNGDYIIVKQQATAENGQKVVALINNNEVTLKKYFKEKNFIRLQPANINLKPIIIERSRDLQIQGVVIDTLNTPNYNKVQLLTEVDHLTPKKYELPTNQILCGDCVNVLKNFPSNSVDLIVTSPPYDNVRKYNGFTYDLHATGKELFRVLKDGGIVAMAIQDQTKDFGKSLTSFRTIVDWVDNIGFKLFETVIYRKYGTEGAWWKYRFRVDHEYMPIFLKGVRPAYFNKEPLKIPSKHGGKVMTGSGNRRTDGSTTKTITRPINTMKCRGTVWDYLNAGDKNPLKRKHPAVFPDKIPLDFIQCFCSPKGIVLDPFVGSGSTVVAAKQLGRKYIGIDISKEYCDLTEERLNSVKDNLFENLN